MVRWNDLSFEVPSSMHDESVLTFVDDLDEPAVSLTVAREAATEPLADYVAAARAELTELLPGSKVRADKAVQVAGLDARRLDVELATDDGPRRQAQVYVALDGALAVLTATARPKDFARAELALESVLQSFQVLSSAG